MELTRENDNDFVASSGRGEGPFTFRVTDVEGNVITDTGVPLGDDALAPGATPFPACE